MVQIGRRERLKLCSNSLPSYLSPSSQGRRPPVLIMGFYWAKRIILGSGFFTFIAFFASNDLQQNQVIELKCSVSSISAYWAVTAATALEGRWDNGWLSSGRSLSTRGRFSRSHVSVRITLQDNK